MFLCQKISTCCVCSIFSFLISSFCFLFMFCLSALCVMFSLCYHPSQSGLSAVSLSQGLQLSALKLAHTQTHRSKKPLKQWQKYMNIKQETIFPTTGLYRQMYVWHLSCSSPEGTVEWEAYEKCPTLSPQFVSFSLHLCRSFNVSEPRLDHMVTAVALLLTVFSLGQKQGAHSGK